MAECPESLNQLLVILNIVLVNSCRVASLRYDFDGGSKRQESAGDEAVADQAA